jgi:molybdate transport system permease protein
MLSADEWTILRLSLRIGIWSTIVGLPVAYALAYLLARARSRLLTLLDALITLPLVMPPVIVGLGLLLLLGRQGPLGRWLFETFGVTVAFRWTGAAIAAGVMALPLMVRVLRVSIAAVDRRLEQAARTLGAGPARAFVSITLPLTVPGICAALVLGFARGLGEFGATITFVSNIPGETRTLPIAIYSLLQAPGGEDGAIRLAVISLVLSFVAIVVAELFSNRLQRH